MEERSNTPRASQISQSRRYANRSRSGSEEIKQIFAQSALKSNRSNLLHTPMSASSSTSGLSTSATPVPQQDQSSISGPGLLSWMRNALLPGSSLSRTSSSSSQGLVDQQQIVSLPYISVDEDDPVERQDTPLLPGIVPAFHGKDVENLHRRNPNESARSSLSYEASSSIDEWSLEPLNLIQRRPSAVSAISTAEDDEGSSNSSDEDVYTPFTANEEFAPPLIDCIQPTRFNTGVPCQEDPFEVNASAFITKKDESLEGLRLASKPRLNLTIGQAQNTQQIVKDTTPRNLTAPSVVLTPADSSSDARPMSPIAGWTEDTPTPIAAYTTPLRENLTSGEKQEQSGFGEGDGECLQDTLGSPLSPEEVAMHRPSKESVVLGSRGAHTRSMSESKEGPRKIDNKSALSEWDESRTKTPLALSSANTPSISTIAELDPNDTRDSTLTDTPMAPQAKRANGFFNRRRNSGSQASATEETLALRKVASSNGNQRWRLGRRANNSSVTSTPDGKLDRPSRHQASQRSQPTGSSPQKAGSPTMSEASFMSNPRVSLNDAPIPIRSKDTVIKKGATRTALGPRTQPFAVKVRGRNKSTKERDFSRLYLAQELSLQAPRSSTAPSSVSSVERVQNKSSPAKPSLSHLDSNSSIASSACSANSINTPYRKRATWAMKFSLDGKYLAVAGQESIIRVFGVLDSPEARNKIEMEANLAEDDCDFYTSRGSCPFSTSSSLSSVGKDSLGRTSHSNRDTNLRPTTNLPNLAVFQSEPLREFKGHTSDILELSWSKGGFLLSASMDKTAKIWHMSWPNSLVSFVHGDFVTSAVFHPRDDRFFLSGSLDGKLRLWNITSKKVEYSQEVPGLITACAFTESGDTACVGTFAGHALFYCTEGLNYSSSIAVKSPTGKYAKGGRKITAIEPLSSGPPIPPTESNAKKSKRSESVLITSNDSRVRAYNLKDKSITARFKAKTYDNRTSQIRATVPDDKTYVIAGSEATCPEGGQVHIWDCSEIIPAINGSSTGQDSKKNRSSTATADSAVEYFTAHSSTVTCAVMAPLSTNMHLFASEDYILRQSEVNTKKASIASKNVNQSIISPKLNRIIISVDESAIIRVWRSDSLQTVEG